jgi:hypothetical protein
MEGQPHGQSQAITAQFQCDIYVIDDYSLRPPNKQGLQSGLGEQQNNQI